MADTQRGLDTMRRYRHARTRPGAGAAIGSRNTRRPRGVTVADIALDWFTIDQAIDELGESLLGEDIDAVLEHIASEAGWITPG
jgi:hypothetical protein